MSSVLGRPKGPCSQYSGPQVVRLSLTHKGARCKVCFSIPGTHVDFSPHGCSVGTPPKREHVSDDKLHTKPMSV